jgi:hypothetical protein
VTVAVALLAPLAACDSSSPAGPVSYSASSASEDPSSEPPSSSEIHYESVLLSTADIPIPGLRLTVTSSGGATAEGAAAQFTSGSGDVAVTDVVSVFATSDEAGIALAAAVDVAPGQIDGPQERGLDGSGGKAYTGTQSGGAVTIAVFQVDRAFVTLRFQSDLSDPIGSDIVDRVVQAQRTKIRNGLN